MSKPSLQRRVVEAAEDVLREQQFVALADILGLLGWVHPVNMDAWRRGRIESLDSLLPVPADRLLQACEHLMTWAQEQGLQPREVEYLAADRSRRQLTFLSGTAPQDESVLRTHWCSSQYQPAGPAAVRPPGKAPDLVVVIPRKEWTCAGCGESGEFLVMESNEPLCLDCADMGHLEFLPSGDAALTRRARKASTLSAVVVQFARARKRYERKGILVEVAALAHAEQQCLADSGVRERRCDRDRERWAHEDMVFQAALAAEIRRLFPGCPVDRAESIARHAGTRNSGRVGRSAAGRALDERAVVLAVVASVRHTATDYDALLMSGVARADARDRVAARIDGLLAKWRAEA